MLTDTTARRLAAALAVVGSLMLAWFSLGVGIIGADGDPANIMYFGVIAIGLAGAFVARGRPRGMARVLVAMAGGILVVLLIALLAPLGRPYSGPMELILLNGFFVALYLAAAWLFDRAARARPADSPA
jgi:hypothetical protein